MGIVHTGETGHDKELAKWNTPKRLGGHGPDGYERFPLMLYRAFKRENGRVECMEPPPPLWQYKEPADYARAEATAAAFTRQCQMTVQNELEYDRARAMGWCDTVGDALAYHEALERDIADAAAEAAAQVKRMSAPAQAEYAAADAATDAHVVDVPAKQKPGRKPKAASVAA